MKEMTLHERFTRFIIPFKDYTEPFFSNQIHILIKDDILNVVLFIPLGLYLAYFVRENKLLWVIVVTLSLSLVFELFQLFSLIGSFATKDVITNMFGSFLGYLFCRIIYRKENSGAKLIVLNVISVVAILVFCPILIYAVVNTASNFDVYVDVLLRRFNTAICYIL
jgi:glycopeptide antibiotics resistance protein